MAVPKAFYKIRATECPAILYHPKGYRNPVDSYHDNIKYTYHNAINTLPL